MFGVDHLILGPGIGLAEEMDDLIRAHAADDAGRIEAMGLADRAAQGGMVGRGVAVQLVDRALKRILRLVRGAKGVFV